MCQWLPLGEARDQLGEVAGLELVIELIAKDLLPTGLHRVARPGQAEDQRAVSEAADSARLDGRRTDLVVADLAKQLAETVDFLVEEDRDRLGRAIPPGKAGAAGRDDRLNIGVGDPGAQRGADRVDVIAYDVARAEVVPLTADRFCEPVAGFVVLEGARIRNRQQSAFKRELSRHAHCGHDAPGDASLPRQRS